MASPINKKTLKHLAKLTRLELPEREENRILKDLQEILIYFKQLEELDTSQVDSVNSEFKQINIFRDDSDRVNSLRGRGREAFPRDKNGLLETPAVFKRHD